MSYMRILARALQQRLPIKLFSRSWQRAKASSSASMRVGMWIDTGFSP